MPFRRNTTRSGPRSIGATIASRLPTLATRYPQRLPSNALSDGWEKADGAQRGQIKWHGKDIRLTQALWGQEIGLQPVGDGLWAAYFEALD